MPSCNECGSNVDLAKDSNMGHCATCNNIVEVKPEEKASEAKKDDKPKEEVKK
ncbi:hypothetical protein LTR91_002644 [Friedmanniomyces endolithicus]|uniref:Uncharacterized protein n=1 Tax=Friedmanniomyces endolithicus TaxID=329885 RepID=A0A4U0TY44_9PEZI|nr:hypothetical protein LTS09_016782 [Friedmanniomyces endolithicus]KAK0286130.1 hypothetical protein LTR35_004564 [Friedmanniomyces endolithicus]KAK0299031.1 hypothetical protein LTS00_002141 [Friedmanniomyces endolithicus]KAK0306867.1 hypothetical protein LTR01_006163 [Friedmanniomyces endolithicus]KAK0322870.1 hypothetical protein LTR82_006327 [Friedmanniomyces endolithicus]